MHSFIRGGQITLHALHMIKQVYKALMFGAVLLGIVIVLSTIIVRNNSYNFYLLGVYFLADVDFSIAHDGNKEIKIFNLFGEEKHLKIIDLLQNKNILQIKDKIIDDMFLGLHYAAYLVFMVLLGLIIYFIKCGRKLGEESYIRGGKFIESDKLIKLILSYNRKFPTKKKYTLADIPYPAYTESLHTIITGGSGSGKTVLISNLIEQIRKNGDRAIIYDKMGTFTKYFYCEDKDIILNPLDLRTPSWNLFKEVRHLADLNSIADALIPSEKGSSDPFWTQAARMLFSEVCGVLKDDPEADTQKLLQLLLKKDLVDIAQIIKGTAAQAIIDERSPKTALSVMAVLATNLRSMKYLKSNGKNFSIREWINDENQQGFLLITSRGDQHSALKPLISTWIEIAINSLLSLEQNRERKIWIILDELPSLHYLPSLHSGLAESRQFGGAFVLSLQLMAQLRSIYGIHEAEATSGLCRTRVVFTTPDEDTAKWCAESLGKIEIEEITESISYGANETRDGINIQPRRLIKGLVLSSEIMNLENLEAYLRFANGFPISRIKIPFTERKELSLRFIANDNKDENIIDSTNNIAKSEIYKGLDVLTEEATNDNIEDKITAPKKDLYGFITD